MPVAANNPNSSDQAKRPRQSGTPVVAGADHDFPSWLSIIMPEPVSSATNFDNLGEYSSRPQLCAVALPAVQLMPSVDQIACGAALPVATKMPLSSDQTTTCQSPTTVERSTQTTPSVELAMVVPLASSATATNKLSFADQQTEAQLRGVIEWVVQTSPSRLNPPFPALPSPTILRSSGA